MRNKQQLRINDVLYYIHKDISAPLCGRDLARIAAYSEQHFHRVFKQAVGETLNTYIRRTRLEHAANQLMFDHQSSVIAVAEKCGFVSLSSFNKVFKQQFGMTPGEWRYQEVSKPKLPYLVDNEIRAGFNRIKSLALPKPTIIERKPQRVAYIRHQGYDRNIRNTWQKLVAWAIEEGAYNEAEQIGLHHSNPAWVPLEQCRYVACLAIEQPLHKRGVVNQFVIPGGLHAVFRLSGRYGELLPWYGRILDQWLPQSGFRLQTTPVLAKYHDNHFLNHNEHFNVDLCVPISTM